MKKDIFILGLTYFGMHDSCAVLLKNGEVIAAAEEERFTRVKFDRSFPKNSIKFCLKQAGITVKDVQYAGYFWQPWKGIGNRLYYYLQNFPGFLTDQKRVGVLMDQFRAKATLQKETGFKGKFYYLDHHVTHAASAFYLSGFEKAAILSLDGTGEKTSCWIGYGDGTSIKAYKSISWPHSVGQIYRTVTQFLGFEIFTDEYKVMGLSAYGKPTYLKEFRKILKTRKDGDVIVDLSYIQYQFGKERMYSDKWIEVFGLPRKKGERIEKRHEDIAASLQVRTEEIFDHVAKFAMRKFGKGPLCIAGGVGLNSVAVGKLVESGMATEIYTPPVSADPGCAFGAAYYIYHAILKYPRTSALSHAYWGREFSDEEILKVIRKRKLDVKYLKCPEKKAAELISKGRVIGWFQGRSEIGQRALGDRSILADARDRDMKDKVNRLVKYREPFRPFAPAILEEYQTEYFNYEKPVPYMTEVHSIKRSMRKKIPAVVHVDGTGRIQTVLKKTNPKFYKVIEEFYKLTGVPVVLNTSFNVQGEPIVDSPDDAIRTFLNSGIDDVILGSYWISK